MPMQFKKNESPGKALRRVCRGHVGEALSWLQKSRRPAAIHNVRKEIKKLRALLGLVEARDSLRAGRKAVKGLRQAADRLAGPRDARVMLRAFEKLTGEEAAKFPKIHEALLKHCRRETRQFRDEDALMVARRLLKKTGRRVNKLKVKTSGWAALEPGLKQSYGRGQAFFKLVVQQPSPEHFHDWRKHVKNFCYHLQTLCPEWPEDTRALTEKLASLGEQLGEDHDLFLLEQFAGQQGDEREASALRRRIAARQKKLRAVSLKLGAPAFAKPPAAVCRQLEFQWEAWRDGEESR